MSRVIRPYDSTTPDEHSDPIFCCKCKYIQKECRVQSFPRGDSEERELYVCKYPRNIRYKVTWFERKEYYARSPKTINKNNDCIWFENIKILINSKETQQLITEKINTAVHDILEERDELW